MTCIITFLRVIVLLAGNRKTILFPLQEILYERANKVKTQDEERLRVNELFLFIR